MDAKRMTHLFNTQSAPSFGAMAPTCYDSTWRKCEKLPIMRLPSLKKLIIMPLILNTEPVREFLLVNAKTLTVLKMRRIPLQLHPAVVFPNLIQLECWCIDGAGRRAFPALTRLMVLMPVTPEFLISLPADQMLSLEVGFLRQSERKDVVSAVSKMKNLKSLKLTDSGWSEADDTLTTLSSIFDNMHDLEKVRLHSDHNCFTGDAMISTLVNQNTKLSHISFVRIHLTDAALTSLAQLQHLTKIRIQKSKKVTTAGVLTLLRGSSRNVIHKFLVHTEQVDHDQVTSEIRLLCEEQGATFDTHDTRGFFIYFSDDVIDI